MRVNTYVLWTLYSLLVITTTSVNNCNVLCGRKKGMFSIVPTAVMDMEHSIALSSRKPNIAVVIECQMTAMLKFFTQKNPAFFQKHLRRGYALGMCRSFYHFLDLFQCKHFVHLSAFRLRVNWKKQQKSSQIHPFFFERESKIPLAAFYYFLKSLY